MLRVLKKTNINFIGVRRQAFILSGIIVMAGIISLIAHKGPRYGIDFTGGSLVEVHFDNYVSEKDIRDLLSNIGFPDAIIQSVRETKYNFLIRTKSTSGLGEKLIEAFKEELPNNVPTIEREEMIGPAVSKGLQQRAFWVVVVGMIVMLIYISIRFTFRFGVGAVVALIHDVLITIGILSLLNKEFTISIIAALLTIIGYSINDTIVISDRVRENLRSLRKESFPEIVNRSVNETLSRTIITSGTTLAVLLSLFLFGGRVIHDFAFTLMVGVIVGTYSSVFIVAALVVEWERLSPSYRRR
ncbi:MAG TPA: protein translocase subunit SecF, partial [bacterium (Candidatus Stahlbacteria)]|nr:protein translocase subunit SecF [Candidatus Stahlbacteria bacterium]